jgi:hypothetical protein
VEKSNTGETIFLARAHPVAIRADRVDLAVVGQIAERLRQPPLRRRVGGEAVVEHGRAGGEIGAGKVGIKRAQTVRQDHRLVADHRSRQ